MTKGEMLKAIRVRFLNKLMTKTNWGRNELMDAYDAAVREVVEELLE